MTTALKLFFDECCSQRLSKTLLDLFKDDFPPGDLKIMHLADVFQRGDDDEDWIPLLESEKDWIVITTDRGKDPKREKLPVICTRLCVTHVVATSTFLEKPFALQKESLLVVWPMLKRLPLLPRGTKVSLGYRTFERYDWPFLTVQNKSIPRYLRELSIPF